MILDDLLQFSDSQALTATAVSTNIVDLGAVRDIGTGESLYVVVNVEVAFTDAGSDSTITVALQGDSTTTITPDGTQDLFIIPALAAAGSVYIARLDPGAAPLAYRYLQLNYTATGGDLTTGTVSAHIAHNIDKYVSYADNITIS